MIVDSNNTQMTHNSALDHDANQDMQEPPSYDSAMRDISSDKASDVKVSPPPAQDGGPSLQSPMMPATTVYNYVNPITQEHVVSLLPPNHPQMICLQQGGHVPHTRFGLLGILAAIFWFPLGVGCCLLDRRVYCEQCGATLDEGVCG
ncbi:hypothetical protein B0H21DRAFT_727511 [Amylocystis lapponica]|nr:hypothetical protein B0H21DRAFT_727511 [Amylocystis lapponica]